MGLLLFLCLVLSPSPGNTSVHLISETDREVIFEATFPPPAPQPVTIGELSYWAFPANDLISPTVPGLPAFPFAEVKLALPPGCEAVFELIDADFSHLVNGRPLPTAAINFPANRSDASLPEYAYQADGEVYEGIVPYPKEPVALLPSCNWRHLRTVPLRLHPLRYYPAEQRLTWYSRLRVVVTFVKTKSAESNNPTRTVTIPEPQWDEIYRREIINYNHLQSFKRAPLPAITPGLQKQVEPDFLFRFAISATDLYSVAFEQLFATVEPRAWTSLSLYLADWEDDFGYQESLCRFHPLDADNDQLFGPGDQFVFYGQSAGDCFSLSPGDRRYGEKNVYWLAVGEGGDSLIETIPAWYDRDDLTTLSSYQTMIHYEENRIYGSDLVSGDSTHHLRGPFAIMTDHYNWTSPDPIRDGSIQAVPIDLPYMRSLDRVQVHLVGQATMGDYHRPRLWFSRTEACTIGSLTPADTAWALPGNPYHVNRYRDLLIDLAADDELPPSSALGPGRNYLKIYQPWTGDGLDNINCAGIGINHVEINCTCSWRLAQHRLEADLSDDGVVQIRIQRVGSKAMLIFDLTDPRAPLALDLADSLFSLNGSTRFDLKLQFDCGDDGLPNKLLAVEQDYIKALTDDQIKLDATMALPFYTGEDLIAVFPGRFASALEPLLLHRASSGHRIYRAPLEAIYKEYSGGRPHPYAIKRMLRAIWRSGETPPDYLLLAGDASEDIAGYIGVHNDGYADSTYVPLVTTPGFLGGRELTACDHWFVDNLAGEWGDQMSGNLDLHLGRIPCGSEDELTTYVNKVVAYESASLTEPWRKRVIVHSDDSFSSTLGGISGSGGYRNYSGERVFADISRASIESVVSTGLFSGVEIEKLFHSDWDSIPSLGRCTRDPADTSRCLFLADGSPMLNLYDIPYQLNIAYGQTVFKDKLINSLNEGALIWSYQGHSNRKLLSHEYVFQHAASRSRDVFQLENEDKPFFFIGAGCHLAAFGYKNEAQQLVGGDAMTEVMLFCCDDEPKGGIAAFASTDYELIGHRMEEYFFDAMFSVTVDGDGNEQQAPRWRAGDLVTAAKAMCPSYDRQRQMYTLLGDPALRLSLFAPEISVLLNQAPWTPGTDSYCSSLENDSLEVTVQLLDESYLTGPQISDYYGQVPDDSIQVVEDVGARRLLVSYRTQVQRQSYTIQIQGEDNEGIEYLASVPIPFEVTFQVLESDLLRLLHPGDMFDRSSPLAVSIRCGAHMDEADITLLANGVPLALESAEVTAADNAPFIWDCRFEPPLSFESGPLTLELEVIQHDGSVYSAASQAVEIGATELFIKDCWWIPSPFDDETTLVYNLSLNADRVRLRIFTATGACILETDSDDSHPCLQPALPLSRGIVSTGAPVWNGRDDDGDSVANGIYFFELTVWDESGQIADKVIDKLARFRN